MIVALRRLLVILIVVATFGSFAIWFNNNCVPTSARPQVITPQDYQP